MKQLSFKGYEEFVSSVVNVLKKSYEDFFTVGVVAKYNEAQEVLREALCMGYDIAHINIEYEELDGYDAEFIVSLSKSDDGIKVWCEPMLREDGYLNEESAITYVFDNCSSTVLKHIEGVMVEISIEEEAECQCCHECDRTVSNSDSSDKEKMKKLRDKADEFSEWVEILDALKILNEVAKDISLFRHLSF